jgi:hypothetical protein
MNRQSQWLFEVPVDLKIDSRTNEGAFRPIRSRAEKCMCKRCQETEHLLSNPSYSESLNESGGWFWQALGQAQSALKGAKIYLQSRNLDGVRQSLEIARQRVNLAGKTMGQLSRYKVIKEKLAFGHVAIQKAQRQLASQNVNIVAVLAELRKAHEAISGTMELALKARSGDKIWN